jgi:hypothetical protein
MLGCLRDLENDINSDGILTFGEYANGLMRRLKTNTTVAVDAHSGTNDPIVIASGAGIVPYFGPGARLEDAPIPPPRTVDGRVIGKEELPSVPPPRTYTAVEPFAGLALDAISWSMPVGQAISRVSGVVPRLDLRMSIDSNFSAWANFQTFDSLSGYAGHSGALGIDWRPFGDDVITLSVGPAFGRWGPRDSILSSGVPFLSEFVPDGFGSITFDFFSETLSAGVAVLHGRFTDTRFDSGAIFEQSVGIASVFLSARLGSFRIVVSGGFSTSLQDLSDARLRFVYEIKL